MNVPPIRADLEPHALTLWEAICVILLKIAHVVISELAQCVSVSVYFIVNGIYSLYK